MQNFDINSWGNFLATPPNMSGTPPGVYSDLVMSNSQEIQTTPIFDDQQIQSFLNPSPVVQSSPTQQKPVVQQSYQPPTPPQNQTQKQMSAQNFMDSGEIENRTLLVTGADTSTTKNDILEVFNLQDNINKINLSNISQGTFTVEYFDIRQAINAKLLLNGSKFKGNVISVTFAPLPVFLDPKKPPNNGTIVIFKLPSGITDDQIHTIFGQFGEIRQIRGTPTKPQQKFVEYYDTRAAEAALMNMGGKYVMGCRVSIEFSLPGGFRRGIHKVEVPHHTSSPLIQKTNF